jgi:hypothetical protein
LCEVLYPSDEKPLHRSVYDDVVKGLTYYKHSCSGLKTKNSTGMSIGLVFRVSRHQAVVHKDTGLITLSKEHSTLNRQMEDQSRTDEKSKKRAEILKKFIEEEGTLKQQWESLYKDGLTNIISQYFSKAIN